MTDYLDLAINKNNNLDYANDDDDLFYDTCRRGCLSSILTMIKMEPNGCDYNNGLIAACTGGHITIAKLMIEKGAYVKNDALRAACEHKHKHTAEYLVSKGASGMLLYAFSHDNNWRDCIVKYFYLYEDGQFDLPTSGFYDFIFVDKQKPQVITDIRVKLFDKNLLL